MCCAQTGSGKTCAFLLPVVAALGWEKLGDRAGTGAAAGTADGAASPRCIVLAPTRELAAQIALEAEKLCYRAPVRAVVVYGGVRAQRIWIRVANT